MFRKCRLPVAANGVCRRTSSVPFARAARAARAAPSRGRQLEQRRWNRTEARCN